ncbi:hypothetical protein [Streptosporangium sp. CA-115845]|uniref:hypothetical protein n=1 Tax=Streptosporangium sp. CA-115845 TaxID=3240071 RepID=UPI003D94CF99
MNLSEHDLELCPFNCRELVLITRTERGRELAVNPAPDPKGNTAVWKNSAGAWRSRSLAGHEAMPLLSYEELHMPHVATSPACRPAPPAATLPGLATFARGRPRTARLPYPRRTR